MTGLGAQSVLVLMYHSVSEGTGPTCTPPATFQAQLDVLAESGYGVYGLPDLIEWRQGKRELGNRCAVLTFDDGFADFATSASPRLERRDWPATVFLPVGRLGGNDVWESHSAECPPRKLMTWDDVRRLSDRGIDFGAHGVTHSDLTRLPLPVAVEEITHSKRMLEEQIGTPVFTFSAPYGKSNKALQPVVAATYTASVGTRCAAVHRGSDLYALPRIEMYYFRDIRRWRAFLNGRGSTYFVLRRFLRGFRNLYSISCPSQQASSAQRRSFRFLTNLNRSRL